MTSSYKTKEIVSSTADTEQEQSKSRGAIAGWCQAGRAAGGGRGHAHPPARSKGEREKREREAGGGIFGRDHRVRQRERETKREIGRGSEKQRVSEAKIERLLPVAIAPGARPTNLADAFLSPRVRICHETPPNEGQQSSLKPAKMGCHRASLRYFLILQQLEFAIWK
ncbi:uncharacterized protein LOC120295975 [Eucalyptus grandis]|uniref:uncharacterized protein LOC120295975 n=1 Tax=Eucalyptus grandis TaxID=71139 RepID=UPI00192EE145|nr:uncharacterized protein LOC120295975 [Eucalyptus grandis]